MKFVCNMAKSGDWPSTAILLRTNALVDVYVTKLRELGANVQTRQEHVRPADWEACLAVLQCMADPLNDRLATMAIARLRGQRTADQVALKALRDNKTVNDVCMHFPVLPEDVIVLAELERAQISQESRGLVADLVPDGSDIGALLLRLQERPMKQDGEGISVLTIHGAKGREWETVYLPHMVQGTLPSARSKTPEQVAEERRLCYVAVTRAKRFLHLSYHDRTIQRWGGTVDARPSQFLAEMGLL